MNCLFGKLIGIRGEIIENGYRRNVDIPIGLWGFTPGEAHHSSGPQMLGPQLQKGLLSVPTETTVPGRAAEE